MHLTVFSSESVKSPVNLAVSLSRHGTEKRRPHGGAKRRPRRPGSSGQACHVVPWPVAVSGARGAASRASVGVPSARTDSPRRASALHGPKRARARAWRVSKGRGSARKVARGCQRCVSEASRSVPRHGATRRCQPGRARGRATAGAARTALYFVTPSLVMSVHQRASLLKHVCCILQPQPCRICRAVPAHITKQEHPLLISCSSLPCVARCCQRNACADSCPCSTQTHTSSAIRHASYIPMTFVYVCGVRACTCDL